MKTAESFYNFFRLSYICRQCPVPKILFMYVIIKSILNSLLRSFKHFLLPDCQCTVPKNSKQIFPELKLHSCSCERFIVCLFCCIVFADQWWEYINRSPIHECRNLERGREVSFLGIFVTNFRHNAFAVRALGSLTLIKLLLRILLIITYINKFCEGSSFHFSY